MKEHCESTIENYAEIYHTSRIKDSAEMPPAEFKDCLRSLSVPIKMLDGVPVARVYGAGKTKAAYFTVSEDRFTLFVTKAQFKKNRVGQSSRGSAMLVLRANIDEEREEAFAIDIGSIVRIQKGHTTHKFELLKKRNFSTNFHCETDPNKCFSIIYVGGRSIDLIVDDHESYRDEIVDALEHLMHTYAANKVTVGVDVLLLRYVWYDVDKNMNDTIDSKELAEIFRRINYAIDKKDSDSLCKIISNVKKPGTTDCHVGELTFEQCATILHTLRCNNTQEVRPVVDIMVDLFGEQIKHGKILEKVSAEMFFRFFLLTKQRESNMTMEDVRQIFCRLNQIEIVDVVSNLKLKNTVVETSTRFECIDYDRFESYLMSEENDIFDPAKEKFDPSLMNSRALSEFWINSSHNTYLTGDQLKSWSSVEMYTNALHQGCRCLELDCWDGEGDLQQKYMPVIYHGHTLTSRIPFCAVIEAIKVFLNGKSNSYPIILSLENHCSIPFQEVMARCMIKIFGDSLFVPHEDLIENPIPSADIMKGKVILKGRRITGSEDETYPDAELESDDSELVDNKKFKLKMPSLKISPELSAITYFHSYDIKSFKESINTPPYHMHSFGESQAKRCSQKKDVRNDWISYNRYHMSRTYPARRRVDSSNYNPILAWSLGCQLVAMNLQIPDSARRLNDGRFRVNGGCGYVPKPHSINTVNTFPPQPLILFLKVLCGSCLPKPRGKKTGERIDPYVHVCLFDIAADSGKEIKTNHYTHHVKNNGFNPVWTQREAFKYVVQNPEVAMLQLTVLDKDKIGENDFIASASIPVSCVRQGYRSVKLFDRENTRSGPFEWTSLLVEVAIGKVIVKNRSETCRCE